MIYIKNNLERQDLFIPRNDGSTCYVSPYDKGYEDGYQDGLDDCGAGCTLQEKDVTVTASTMTVRPDDGYVGMESVNINASQYGLQEYNEGYHEGESAGESAQKAKLATTAFTANGVYTREDGWDEVKVEVPKEVNLGSLIDSPSLNELFDGTRYIKEFDAEHATADGWGDVYLDLVHVIYDAKDEQKNLMSSTAFTQNGVYTRENGWDEVEVIVSCPAPNLEQKSETVTAGTQTILPSSGYDGMSSVSLDASQLISDKLEEGYQDGFTDGLTSGVTTQKSLLSYTAFTQNGEYSRENGWSAVTVDVTCPAPNIERGVSFPLNSGFTRTVVNPSSGYDGIGDITIYDNGYGEERYNNGYSTGYAQGQADCPSCPNPNLEQRSETLTATTECFTPSSGYDGIGEICIDATDIYNQGYEDGQGDLEGRNNYFTFEAIESGEIGFHHNSCQPSQQVTPLTVSYSINGGSWSSITSNTASTNQITVQAGDVVRFKGTNAAYHNQTNSGCGITHKFNNTGKCYVYGNIMSLIYGDSFLLQDTLTEGYAFFSFFSDNQNILLHPDKPLVLPATTLTRNCYTYMFSGTSITSAPKLPSETASYRCYYAMFMDCANLTEAPSLPATTLAEECYMHMFDGCSSLVVPPALPATTLATACYDEMFVDCTSLVAAPELMATVIPTLAFSSSYSSMFAGCSSLSYIKCNATTIDTQYGVDDWVNGVAASGVFLKNPSMNDWQIGDNGIPSGWTVRNIQ